MDFSKHFYGLFHAFLMHFLTSFSINDNYFRNEFIDAFPHIVSRFDTAENEPSKVCRITRQSAPCRRCAFRRRSTSASGGLRRRPCTPPRRGRPGRTPERNLGKISAKCCSFSAVSAPIFASNYAFCSMFQDLH